MFNVFLDAPNLGELEKKCIDEVIDSGDISTIGSLVTEFEDKFARYVGAKKAISTQSGTAAIHIALYELEIGKDDEVIVPGLTFISTVNSVLYVGAKPVIVDVEPDSWNIDPEEVRRNLTKSTKAIIPVHLYGNPCNIDAILEIAEDYGIYAIEDATESLGARYKGKQTGTFGDFGCFSFNGNKLITTGGGGMVVTDDEKRAEHIKFLVNQARDSSRGYYHPEMGFNYRMTNIEAALGLTQLERIEEFLNKKRRFKRIYEEILNNLAHIKFQKEYREANGSWWLTCIKFDKKEVDINELILKLKEKNIPTRRVFMPLYEMPYLKKFSKPCPNASEIYKKGICLPSSTLNQERDIEEVALLIRKILDG